MMDTKLKAFVVATLRRASYRHPGRTEALKNNRVGRNQYICVECGPEVIHGRKNIQLDHINSVVPVTGWDSFDGFIERLFCGKEGYQVLCREHHAIKSKTENAERRENKKKGNK